MTELGFLIELLLNHDLPKDTKALIAIRIKEVESKLVPQQFTLTHTQPAPPKLQQAPSTLALMAKHGDIISAPVMPPVETPVPVDQIAQTPATAAAMNSRNQAIQEALAGKIDKTTGRPKKW